MFIRGWVWTDVALGMDVTSPAVTGMTKVKGCSVMQVWAMPCEKTMCKGVGHGCAAVGSELSSLCKVTQRVCAYEDAAVDCEGTRTVVSQSILVCASVCVHRWNSYNISVQQVDGTSKRTRGGHTHLPEPHLFNEPAYHAQLSPFPLNPVLASFHVVSGLGKIPSEIVFSSPSYQIASLMASAFVKLSTWALFSLHAEFIRFPRVLCIVFLLQWNAVSSMECSVMQGWRACLRRFWFVLTSNFPSLLCKPKLRHYFFGNESNSHLNLKLITFLCGLQVCIFRHAHSQASPRLCSSVTFTIHDVVLTFHVFFFTLIAIRTFLFVLCLNCCTAGFPIFFPHLRLQLKIPTCAITAI